MRALAQGWLALFLLGVAVGRLLLAAMAGGKHERFVARFGSWWERVRPTVGRLVTAAALLVGAFFVLDAGWWFATGEFLVPV